MSKALKLIVLRIIVGTLTAFTLVGFSCGGFLIWLGMQPTKDPHGGGLITIPGVFLVIMTVPIFLADILFVRQVKKMSVIKSEEEKS
jgi:hypothetical protein